MQLTLNSAIALTIAIVAIVTPVMATPVELEPRCCGPYPPVRSFDCKGNGIQTDNCAPVLRMLDGQISSSLHYIWEYFYREQLQYVDLYVESGRKEVDVDGGASAMGKAHH